jgi:hypothetical protein
MAARKSAGPKKRAFSPHLCAECARRQARADINPLKRVFEGKCGACDVVKQVADKASFGAIGTMK